MHPKILTYSRREQPNFALPSSIPAPKVMKRSRYWCSTSICKWNSSIWNRGASALSEPTDLRWQKLPGLFNLNPSTASKTDTHTRTQATQAVNTGTTKESSGHSLSLYLSLYVRTPRLESYANLAVLLAVLCFQHICLEFLLPLCWLRHALVHLVFRADLSWLWDFHPLYLTSAPWRPGVLHSCKCALGCYYLCLSCCVWVSLPSATVYFSILLFYV